MVLELLVKEEEALYVTYIVTQCKKHSEMYALHLPLPPAGSSGQLQLGVDPATFSIPA